MDHNAKRELFDSFSKIANALASGRRLEIIDVLSQGERSVEELSKEIDQSLANTSHHLQVLLRAGLVRSRREGTFIYYYLAFSQIEELWSSLRQVGEQSIKDLESLAKQYLGSTDGIEVISRDQLVKLTSNGEVTIIDVRPSYEYFSGHLPGALSVPLDELDDFISSLPINSTVVAYCRGPYCAFAPEAVRRLGDSGVRAMRLEDGFPQWRKAGYPVAEGFEA